MVPETDTKQNSITCWPGHCPLTRFPDRLIDAVGSETVWGIVYAPWENRSSDFYLSSRRLAGEGKPKTEQIRERQPLSFCSQAQSPRAPIQVSRQVAKGTLTIVFLTRFLLREEQVGRTCGCQAIHTFIDIWQGSDTVTNWVTDCVTSRGAGASKKWSGITVKPGINSRSDTFFFIFYLICIFYLHCALIEVSTHVGLFQTFFCW